MSDMFRGFDDYMEEKEPGWKARQAAARQDKEDARLATRRRLIKQYGSHEAAVAPTFNEATLILALAPFQKAVVQTCNGEKYMRITLAGWTPSDFDTKPSKKVIAAAKSALPMPLTILGASMECAWWESREAELQALEPEPFGDYLLDQACVLRLTIVRELLETGLRATCISDVLARQRHLVATEHSMPEVEAAVLADLEHLATVEQAHFE